MQGKQKLYNIEDDKNTLTKNPSKTKRCKKMPTDQTEPKSAYLSISKAKAKQFQRQPKKIQKSDENLQEEAKEYLRKNVDHHSNGVVNKTISKDVYKNSIKCARDNLDKSAEFIFNLVK